MRDHDQPDHHEPDHHEPDYNADETQLGDAEPSAASVEDSMADAAPPNSDGSSEHEVSPAGSDPEEPEVGPSTDSGSSPVDPGEKLFDPDGLVVAGFNNPNPAPLPESNTGRNLLVGLGGLLAIGLVAGIVAFNGSEVRTTPEELGSETPRARATTPTDLPIESGGSEGSDPLSFADSPSTTAAGQAGTGRSDDEAPVAAPTVGDLAADRSERLAVFRGGVVYLRGRVPSQEVADTIAARAAAVVGPENVVVEYEIDPAAPLPVGAPLYVEDLVLFAYDSTDIGPEFLPLLELGVTLLEQVPTVTVEVRGHTDASGPDNYNLDLSQRRVDSVVDYWVSRGVDAERVTGVGYGETDLLDVANPNSKLNRRVEFIISGILG